MVVGPTAFWPKVVLGEIEKLSADLDCGQIEEMPNRLDSHVRQGPVQPDHGVLVNVVRLFPSPQARVAMKHLAGEPQQSVAGMIEKCSMSLGIA